MTWEELRAQCLQCRRCALSDTRTNVVFGDGVRTAEIMFVGEGPGENEDLSGLPFVGRGGKLLSDMLAIIDLYRENNYYIANIVKCRPPHNRDPLGSEEQACIPWLYEQIELVKPKIIVCLGRIAAAVLIKPDFRISQEHGMIFEREGIKYMALYHPAALLRDPRKRPETFEDLMNLRRTIEGTCPGVYEKK